MISGPSIRPAAAHLNRLFWMAFVPIWAAAIAAFPLIKGMPSGYVPVVAGAVLGLVGLRSEAIARLFSRFDRWPAGRFLTVLLTVTVTLRVAAVALFPREPMVDDAQFHRYAISMLSGAGYGAPWHRAWFPPGMTLLLTAWYSVTGASALWGKLLNVLLAALLTWQTWALAKESVGERAARRAALLVALFPTLVFYTATLGYETLLALLFVLACRLWIRLATSDSSQPLAIVALGLVLGAGALVKPICLLVPAIFGAAWWIAGMSFVRTATRTIGVAIVMILAIAPWTIRNYRVLGQFVPISTNGGYTLYSANNPRATGLAMEVDPLPGEHDEVSRDRVRMRAAITWIVQNPGASFVLSLRKAAYTWGTTSSIMSVVSTDRLPSTVESACKLLLNIAWAVLLVCCASAIVRTREWPAALLPATALVGYLFVLHLFFEAHSRHQIPVLPLLCIVAATALAQSPARATAPIGQPAFTLPS